MNTVPLSKAADTKHGTFHSVQIKIYILFSASHLSADLALVSPEIGLVPSKTLCHIKNNRELSWKRWQRNRSLYHFASQYCVKLTLGADSPYEHTFSTQPVLRLFPVARAESAWGNSGEGHFVDRHPVVWLWCSYMTLSLMVWFKETVACFGFSRGFQDQSVKSLKQLGAGPRILRIKRFQTSN